MENILITIRESFEIARSLDQFYGSYTNFLHVSELVRVSRENVFYFQYSHPSAQVKFRSDRKSLFAPFPQLARAVLPRVALEGELLLRVWNIGRIS